MHPIHWIERLHYFLCYCPEAHTYLSSDDIRRLRRANNVLFHTHQLILRSKLEHTILNYLVSYFIYTKYDLETDYTHIKKMLKKVGILLNACLFKKELEFLSSLNYDLSCLYWCK